MPRSKKRIDVQAFHAAAIAAANAGKTMKEFAKEQGTLANNVKAVLYEAFVEHSLKPVTFPVPEPKRRGRKSQPTNLSPVTLYTGRAKQPYLTLKVPRDIVAQSGAKEDDVFEWRLNRKGDLVGANKGPGFGEE